MFGKSPQPISIMHSITNTGKPKLNCMGNHKDLPRINKISTNYLHTRESYNYKTTFVDIYFSTKITRTFQNNHDRRTMAECEKCSNWPK